MAGLLRKGARSPLSRETFYRVAVELPLNGNLLCLLIIWKIPETDANSARAAWHRRVANRPRSRSHLPADASNIRLSEPACGCLVTQDRWMERARHLTNRVSRPSVADGARKGEGHANGLSTTPVEVSNTARITAGRSTAKTA